VDFTVNQERLRTFLAHMEHWMREGDVVRRKTLLREVYQEIREVRSFHKLVVSPTGFAGLWTQDFQGLIRIA
jgi:hypothetical protein